jgi:Tat protein secretion system quality control protein TatD with DNase activity
MGEKSRPGKLNRLTPFKVSMAHQRAIVEAQMEIAVELGVNVSFHSVAAAGQYLEVLAWF